MPKRWRMLSLAGFQKELYVAYRKGIYFRSPFDSKNHKELSYRSVTLSAYILHMRVLLERARYMKLRLPERNTHPVASSARYPSILPLLSAFASFDWEIPWNYRRAWNWIRGKVTAMNSYAFRTQFGIYRKRTPSIKFWLSTFPTTQFSTSHKASHHHPLSIISTAQ